MKTLSILARMEGLNASKGMCSLVKTHQCGQGLKIIDLDIYYYSFFVQEGLSQQCAEAMVETINRATVCAYHVAATQYCETEVQAKCVKWLERRLTSETSVSLLKEIRWDITLSRFTALRSSRHYIITLQQTARPQLVPRSSRLTV